MQRTLALTLLVAGGLVFTACNDNQLTGFEDQLLEKRVGARGNSSSVTVMTRNLYIGADVDPIIEAAAAGRPIEEIIALVNDAFEMMLFTNYPARAEAIAAEIMDTKPHLVGLQEVYLIESGDLELDFLNILLWFLQGQYYVATSIENTNVTVPRSEAEVVSLLDRDVILARADVPTTDPLGMNYETVLGPFDLLGEELSIIRGFAAVDAVVDGREFRFVDTHPEPGADEGAMIRQAQIGELIQHLAGETLPVVLVGDLNTDGYTREPGYQMLMDAGFKDAWVRYAGYKDPGFTSGHDADLQNETAAPFHHRIDLILASQLGWASVDILGEEPEDRFEVTVEVEPGVYVSYYLWPSDHAGVVGQLHIPAPNVIVEY